LGVAAIHQGKRVRFFNAVDLVNQLEREKQQGKTGNLAKQLVLFDAVILDELGYLPFPASGGALLFHLISQLYEKTSLIITTNLSFANGSPCSAIQNDNRLARPHHPPLRNPRNRQRFLPLQTAEKIRQINLSNWKDLDADTWKLLDAD
jgi:DNA replication protein DnaC